MKTTIDLSPAQEKQIASLEQTLGCTTRAEVFRKALNIATVVADAQAKGQTIAIEAGGKVIERLRIV